MVIVFVDIITNTCVVSAVTAYTVEYHRSDYITVRLS